MAGLRARRRATEVTQAKSHTPFSVCNSVTRATRIRSSGSYSGSCQLCPSTCMNSQRYRTRYSVVTVCHVSASGGCIGLKHQLRHCEHCSLVLVPKWHVDRVDQIGFRIKQMGQHNMRCSQMKVQSPATFVLCAEVLIPSARLSHPSFKGCISRPPSCSQSPQTDSLVRRHPKCPERSIQGVIIARCCVNSLTTHGGT